MIQLFINNKPVVTTEKISVKFVRENVYFTKTGSYTMEIELPAMIPENIAVFGHIYRKELRKSAATSLSAKLMADNKELLNGTATVTNITDTAIKVQLLGGNAELNFYTKYEKQFVDELDLGTWYDVEGINSNDKTMTTLAENIKSRYDNEVLSIGVDAAFKNLAKRIWNQNTKEAPAEWVMLPCVNENFEVTCNNFTIRQYVVNDETRYYPVIHDKENIYLSAQPYLVPMIERVFRALGYPIEYNCLRENEFFMHMVIATANNRSAINRALPHWEVSRFVEEIENIFAVVINIDEVTKKASIKTRASFFEDNTEYVNNILEEYSVDIEEDNATDISNANIGFAEVPSSYDRIDDELREMATINKSFDNENFTAGLQNLIDHLYDLRARDTSEAKDVLFKYKGTIFKICGRSIIIEIYDQVDPQGRTYPNHARTILIDEFRNLVRNNYNDLDIELGIRPCKTGDAIVTFADSNGTLLEGSSTCFHLVKADNTDPAGIDDEENIYIAGVISGETEIADTKEDTMSICLYDGGMVLRDFIGDSTQDYFRSFLTQVAWPGTTIQCFYPAGYLMSQYSANTYTGGGAIQKFANESLSLNIESFRQKVGNNFYTYKTLYSEVYKNLIHIDTKVKYCFKFVTDKMMKVNSTFLIRNKKFLCEKLEYKIGNNGIDKLVTGYFYELE